MPAGTLNIALAQINATVGEIAGNKTRIFNAWQQAKAQGAQLVVCPELAMIGYPPEDLILMPALRREAMIAMQALAEETGDGPALIVGSVLQEEERIYNAAWVLDGGRITHIQPKTMLPNYGVFDEKRWFVPGSIARTVEINGVRIGVLVCEDVWNTTQAEAYCKQGAELLVIINASPFESGKHAQRRAVAGKSVAACGMPLVYVNLVGGQDDIVFDGDSFALSSQAQEVVRLPEFEEALALVTYTSGDLHPNTPAASAPAEEGEEWRLWSAMALGLRDYIRKNGFSKVLLGLSGGIDSALTATLAADALGSEQVKGVLLPSPYTSRESVEDAMETAHLLGIETFSIPIVPMMEVFDEVLSPVFKDAAWMEEPQVGGNVQSRLRGITLMGLSNRFGWMLLSTGNKSEIAVGYTTLYGDSCGGYNVLKDLYKTQVYHLARWRNAQSAVIPQRSIDKPPSAELKPGQKDEDQLPPYEVLDAILLRHLEERLSAEDIIAQGYARDVVEKVVKLVRMSEYKRRQSAPGVKLSPMLFGRDRRFPLTNKFQPD